MLIDTCDEIHMNEQVAIKVSCLGIGVLTPRQADISSTKFYRNLWAMAPPSESLFLECLHANNAYVFLQNLFKSFFSRYLTVKILVEVCTLSTGGACASLSASGRNAMYHQPRTTKTGLCCPDLVHLMTFLFEKCIIVR